MKESVNLYRVLGVSEHASSEEIKAAYRRMAKKYHPDAHPGDLDCEKKFQEISEAYSILGNSENRKKYDASFQTEKAEKEKVHKKAENQSDTSAPHSSNVDFENVHKTFEQFFGFHPETKDVTNEKKLNPNRRNPLDTTDLFERFMGIKR